MALIVEDGTCLATAESYASVAEADTYHANMGNATWASIATTAAKEAYLRQAAQFMVNRFRPRWKGWRQTTTQRLDWPRLGCYLDDVAAYPIRGRLYGYTYLVPPNTVPAEIKDAQCELALRASVAALAPDLEQGTTSVRAGPVTVSFDRATPQSPRYPQVVAIIQVYLNATSNMVRLSR